MNVEITFAKLTYSKEDGYLGSLHLKVDGHAAQYEMSIQSKKGNDWGYSLAYLTGFGNEEQLLELEDELEDNDDLFDTLIEAAKASLQK